LPFRLVAIPAADYGRPFRDIVLRIVDAPIGVFDSGVGGLTVVKSLRSRLPLEGVIYLGDTARIPYGTRSPAIVERYSIQNASFLEAMNIKMLVIACNTASALALPGVRALVPTIPTLGVIQPGAKHLAIANQASDSVLACRIDAGNGRLKPSGVFAQVPAPVCVKFLPPPDPKR